MSALVLYRDDGPLARAIGGLLALPAATLVLAAAAPLFVTIAVEGAGASDVLAGIVIGWLVIVGGLSRGREGTGGFAWIVPPALRVAEYTALLWLGALAGDAEAAAFALLCALAFRHYDQVYRLRHRGVGPPAWVDLVSLGWEGRLLLGYLLLLVGALPAAFFVLAAVFAVVFVAESVAGWVSGVRVQASVYEEEEDEGQ